ncbi:diguanylate cyclase [Marinobacter nauticus]|uniref:sensor domain-containing diguanylate cyclase n=1 Tax=Marinobacter nauticus TaxID=2743 RepID=UPI001C993BEE|nr:diguanylate cyclase [Marinobacter nauticus]MBY5938000.1 diguanylate cyclase [Marinobacter nauticus]MBY5955229.1 diguanylate cyclase [Marinobacter nauticus]MBY6009020.1 diguanylate cyclase [Marinobacter nauticus]
MTKFHKKIFLFISFTLLISEVIFVALNYRSDKEALQKALEQEGQQSQKTFEVALARTLESMSQLATFVASTPNVQRLMALADRTVSDQESSTIDLGTIRTLLYEEVAPSWQKMTSDYDVRQLHFHLGPGSTSFLRVHKPERYGDNMDELRHLVVDVNRDGKPRQGFELGRVYAGIRGVVPIYSFSDPAKQVGALEVGTSFTTLIHSLSSAIGQDVAVLIREDRIDEAVWRRPGHGFESDCGCFVEASSSNTADDVIASLEKAPGYQPGFDGRTTLATTPNGPVVLTEFALRDYIGIRDDHKVPVGRIMIWGSAEDAIEDLYRTTLTNILYAFAVFVLIELALFFGMRFIITRLEATIDDRTRDIRALNLKLEAMAHLDQLTGVYNRRYLMKRLGEERNRCARLGSPSALIMLDVDHFKRVNDDWGHQAGDTVLYQLGRLMKEHARNYDIVGRYGGEEFVILLPGVDERTGYELGENLRQRVESEITIPGSDSVAVTISAGLAVYREGYREEDWLAAADVALYAAKRSGRNRVVVSNSNMTD